MQIASHHKWKDPEFTPACAWPEKAYVQWGSSGLVLSRKDGGSYMTAFFEAFPGDNAGGFIRGEGPSIAEAEQDCFAKYQREVGCDHRWGRRDYTNGGALCYRCGAFQTRFKPIIDLGAWRNPIHWHEDILLRDDDEEPPEKVSEYMRKIRIRKRLFGVRPKPVYDTPKEAAS